MLTSCSTDAVAPFRSFGVLGRSSRPYHARLISSIGINKYSRNILNKHLHVVSSWVPEQLVLNVGKLAFSSALLLNTALHAAASPVYTRTSMQSALSNGKPKKSITAGSTVSNLVHTLTPLPI